MLNKKRRKHMLKSKLKSLITFLSLLAVSFSFIAGDCGTDSDPQPPGTVAGPGSVSLTVDALPGGGSFAIISWTSSPDQGRSDFSHYRVVTYQANASGTPTSVFAEANNVPKTSSTQTVSSISRGTRYISYVQSVTTSGVRSDSVATEIYGGVYFNNNGMIDQFSSNSAAQSGYGWDPNTGDGQQHSYVSANFAAIDLHMREDSGGNLRFYSPSAQGGSKTTLLGLVGGGQSSFDRTDLNEPTENNAQVVEDVVYLLKTQENNYIKVWVKSINQVVSVPPYTNVEFEYKVQPIEGLRIVKRR
jgi:hypothetical protein